MNLLLDTCVVIDYLGRKKPFFEAAEKVIAAGFFGDARLWIAGQSVNDAFYVLCKYLDAEKVQKAIGAFFELVTPISPDPKDYFKATQLCWDDLEDCLVSICAERAKANYIITRDSKGFSRSSIPAISPDGWLLMMKSEQGLAYGAEDLKKRQ